MTTRTLSESKKGILALVGLAFVFATMGVYARYLDTGLPLFEQTYLRILGASFLGIVLFWRGITLDKILSISIKDWWIILFRSATLAAGVVFFTLAILTTKFSNASFIAVIPLLPLLGYFFLNEKITPRKLFLISLAFLGVLLIALHDFGDLSSWGKGETYALLSAIGFDLSYVGRKWQSEYLNDRESTVVIFFFEGLFILIAGFIAQEPFAPASAFSPAIIGVLIVASLTNVLNLYLTNYGFKRVDVSVAGNILTLETAFALMFGIVLYHEIPVLRELLGGAMIVFSVYQMNKLVQ